MTDNYAIIKKYAKSTEIQQMFQGIVGDAKANSYLYSVVIAVSQSPDLQKCSPESVMRSAARAATLGLSVDPAVGQAYLVPYKGEATFQTGWKGVRDMAYRTGKIAKINVGVLAEGQTWVEDQMTGDARIEGMPTSNTPIGYFAYMKTFSGREHYLCMTVGEINAHKEQYAQGYQSKYSAWTTAFDKMAKKTVLKQLLNAWAELDPAGSEVMRLEEAVESIDEMPDPVTVTVIDEPKRSNAEILGELGFDQALDAIEAEFTDAVVEVVEEPKPEPKAKTKKAKAEPEPEPEPEQDRGVEPPTTKGEMLTWAAKGYIHHVGVADVRGVLDETDDLKKAWNIVLTISKQRADKASEQAELL